MNINRIKSKLQETQLSTKIILILGLFFLTTHCILLLYGINEWYSEYVFGYSISGIYLLINANVIFSFCKLMKAITIFDFMVGQCIVLQEHKHLFDGFLFEARIIVIFIGLILITLLIIKSIVSLFKH